MPIPYNLNPLGISGAKGILGYAPDAFAFWDGLNNQGLGQHDTSATTWADLSGNNNTLVRQDTWNAIIWAADGGITGNGSAANRCLQINKAILSQKFTLEVCLKKHNSNYICWWVNNRYPWINPAAFGFQLFTYNTQLIIFDGYNNSNDPLFSLPETDALPLAQTITISYDGTTLKRYSNGAFYSQTEIQIPEAVLLNTPFCVNGNTQRNSAFSLLYDDSRIYAIRVYHKALSPVEISKNYQLDASRFNL